jgi:hypothetical protein
MSKPRYLDRREASQHLKERGLPVARNTLQKYATVGGGPPYRLFGNRACYLADDLDAWADRKLSQPRTSTAQAEDREAGRADNAA